MRERQSWRTLQWFAIGSLLVHAALFAALLLLADRAGRSAREEPDAAPTVELVMLAQKGHGQTAGESPPVPEQPAKETPPVPAAAAPPPTPPPTPPSRVQPPDATSAPPPTPPQDATATAAEVLLPPPPPPAPSPSAAATPRPPQMAAREARPRAPAAAPAPAPASPAPPAPNVDATPRVNLGGTDDPTNAVAMGDQVIPAGPDPKVRNREPVYPDEAARRHQQGTVVLLIHVSPDGLVRLVDIERSSGFSMLDRAAREAVETWRFVPAVRDGQPIASSMSLRVYFQQN